MIRERIEEEEGYAGGKTIVDDHVRELRPVFAPPRTYQRTIYRPAEICQFDLWEPKAEIPVGHGQTRRGWVVVAGMGYSRAGEPGRYRVVKTVFRDVWEAQLKLDGRFFVRRYPERRATRGQLGESATQ